MARKKKPFGGAQWAGIAVLALFLTGVLFVFGTISFMTYGGNSCDSPPAMTCDCFCCHLFGLRGYESCGMLGGILGALAGITASAAIIYVLWKKR